MSINDNITFLRNMKQGFKRTISWSKCKSEIIAHPKNNNLHYIIDLPFRNINRLSVISLKLGRNISTRNSFNRHYLQLVEIKDFNALIDNKLFLEQSIKNEQEACKKLAEMSRKDDCMDRKLIRLFVPSKIS